MKTFVVSLLCILFAHSELVSVVQVGVSGARSPIQDMPPDEFYESGLNELTPIGVRQQYLLGYYQKATWGRQFLDPNYNENQVYVRSINTNSSIMSCYAQTMGLYRGNGVERLSQAQIKLAHPPVYNNSIFGYLDALLGDYPLPYMIYPIPTHVFNPEVDPLAADICPKANELLMTEYMASTEVDQLMKDYSADLDDLKNTYKLHESFIGKLFLPETLYDVLAADYDSRALGLHPKTITGLKELAKKMAPYAYCGKIDSNSCRLLAHHLNEYIIDIVDDIVYDYSHKAKEAKRCYTLLMTSDRMFSALLKSWGVAIDKAVAPASYVMITITKTDNEEEKEAKFFTVKISLATEKGKPAAAVPICPNGVCDMPTYLSSMNKALYSTQNITKECLLGKKE